MALLDELHRRAQLHVQQQTGATARGVFAVLTPERSVDIRAGVGSAMGQLVAAGQRAAAQLALRYVSELLPALTPVDLDALLAPMIANSARKQFSGVGRFWRLVDEGTELAEARLLAGRYAGGLAEGDVKAASRRGLDAGAAASMGETIAEREARLNAEAEAGMTSRLEVRWRKVPGPGACGWCVAVAGEARYFSAETIPMHVPDAKGRGGVCQCGAAPEQVTAYLRHGRWVVPRGARGPAAGRVIPGRGPGMRASERRAEIPRSNLLPAKQRYLRFAERIYGERFVVHDWNADVSAAVQDLQKVPRSMQRRIAEHLARGPANAGIYLGAGSVVDQDYLERLRGVQPRGWPAGSTFDEVGGVYSWRDRVMAYGSDPRSGSASTALHEYGHLVDDALGSQSARSAFPYQQVLDAAEANRAAIQARGVTPPASTKINPYYTQEGNAGPQEMFAEAFARYHLGPGPWLDELATTREGGRALKSYFRGLESLI